MLVSQVEEPDVVVVLDHTLLKYEEVTSGLVKGGWLIVNSWQHPKELTLGDDFNIATADATRVMLKPGIDNRWPHSCEYSDTWCICPCYESSRDGKYREVNKREIPQKRGRY